MPRADVIEMIETAAWRRRHRPSVEAAAAELAQIAGIDFDQADDVAGITAAAFAQAAQENAPAVAVAAALNGMRNADVIALVRCGRCDGRDEKLALMMADARAVLQAAVDLLDDAAARLEVTRAVVALVDD